MAPTGNVECSIGSNRWRFHLTGSFEGPLPCAIGCVYRVDLSISAADKNSVFDDQR